jgi:hypothetical protein
MAKPFDVTLKELLEAYPTDWATLAGLADVGPITVVNADLSTITTEADKVFRVGAPRPWLLHIEPQASYESGLGRRIHRYNSLLDYRHDLPVQSVVLLLRPEADGPQITGVVERRLPGGRRYLRFEYDVVRVWQLPSEMLLRGGLGTLPLAPVSDPEPSVLPQIVGRMEERIAAEASPAEAAALWTATYLLLGLRYPLDFAARLLRSVRDMKESTTYQAILAEGAASARAEAVEKMREVLLVLGTQRFGEPTPAARKRIEALDNLDHLKRVVEQVMAVESWEELLATR